MVDSRAFKDAVFEQFSRVAGAFASPKRLEIIDLLAQGERTVESIAVSTGMTMSNASRNLQVLRAAGLVTSRREGLYIFYRVADDAVVAGYLQLRVLAESRIAEVSRLSKAFFDSVDGVEPVGFEELMTRSDEVGVVLVDVRPSLEFEAGHLPGAINIPLEDLTERINELDPDANVVAYCRGPYCVLSAQAVAQLRAAGLHAERLTEGPPEWRAAGLPLVVGADPTPVAQAIP